MAANLPPAEGDGDLRQFRNYSCNRCGGALIMIDSRFTASHGIEAIRRRRRCEDCGQRITTFETSAFAPRRLEAIKVSMRNIRDSIDRYLDLVEGAGHD